MPPVANRQQVDSNPRRTSDPMQPQRRGESPSVAAQPTRETDRTVLGLAELKQAWTEYWQSVKG
jgi:hypothetical protein